MKLLRCTVLFALLGAAFAPLLGAKDLSYKAAGVLPYAIGNDGRIKLLLGVSSHRNQASDFGGLRDDEDMQNPKVTAAREGCEELMFILDAEKAFARILALRNKYGNSFNPSKAKSTTYKTLRHALHKAPCAVNGTYRMYFTQIPYQKELPELFKHRKAAYSGSLPHCWHETTKIEWIDLCELLDAIDMRKDHNPIIINGITLYEPFVQSLLIARSQGIIATLSKRTSTVTHTAAIAY
jgi:hypothetical protein